MKKSLKQLSDDLGFRSLTSEKLMNRFSNGAYVSDLLSDVMGKADEGMIWITSQIHKNIVAVASLKELSAIIVVNERTVEQEVLESAELEGVPILSSDMAAFETAGKLYNYFNSSC